MLPVLFRLFPSEYATNIGASAAHGKPDFDFYSIFYIHKKQIKKLIINNLTYKKIFFLTKTFSLKKISF